MWWWWSAPPTPSLASPRSAAISRGFLGASRCRLLRFFFSAVDKFTFADIMAVVLTEEEILAGYTALATDLQYLFTETGVPDRVAGILGALDVTSVSVFALFAGSEKQLRETLDSPPFTEVVEDEAPVLRLKRQVAHARVVDAWEGARARIAEKRRLDAEQRASRQPVTLPASDLVRIRSSFEKAHGRKTDAEFPSDSLLERRLQEVELGDLRAENLQDVVSRAEQTNDPAGAILQKDGTLRMRKGLERVPLPADSEALRQRVMVLAASYEVARTRNPSKTWLKRLQAADWFEHLAYVLGPRVYGLKVTGGSGRSPAWATVLTYEQELRTEALRLVVHEGFELKTALVAARKDTELREMHFVSPTLLSLIDAPRGKQEQAASSGGGGGNSKGNGKGKKNNSKGNKKRKNENQGNDRGNWKFFKKDGVQVCFAFNKDGCRDKGCKRAHVCTICGKEHSARECGAGGGSGSSNSK